MAFLILENCKMVTCATVSKTLFINQSVLSQMCVFYVVDVTVYYSGFHGDLNETMFVGQVDDASHHLVQTAYDCMMKAIEIGIIYTHSTSTIYTQCPS